jgi:hypothetical protein
LNVGSFCLDRLPLGILGSFFHLGYEFIFHAVLGVDTGKNGILMGPQDSGLGLELKFGYDRSTEHEGGVESTPVVAQIS